MFLLFASYERFSNVRVELQSIFYKSELCSFCLHILRMFLRHVVYFEKLNGKERNQERNFETLAY